LLLLYVSAGGGHRSAALALEEEASRRGLSVRAVDLLDFGDGLLRWAFRDLYVLLGERFKAGCGVLYRATDGRARSRFLSSWAAGLLTRRLSSFRELVSSLSPRLCLCTHFTPASLMCEIRERGLWRGTVASVVTDYALHGFWFDPRVDLYFVPSEEVASDLLGLGVDPSRVFVTGIPISRRFTRRLEKGFARRVLGLEEKRTLLLVASSMRAERVRRILEALSMSGAELNVLLVWGRSRPSAALEGLGLGGGVSLRAFGFVREMELLYAASDLMISKGGGLTVTEAMAMGLPMLLTDCIPVQEEANAEHLQRLGCALFLRSSPEEVAERALWLLFCGVEELERMRAICLERAKPFAASRALELALELGGVSCAQVGQGLGG